MATYMLHGAEKGDKRSVPPRGIRSAVSLQGRDGLPSSASAPNAFETRNVSRW